MSRPFAPWPLPHPDAAAVWVHRRRVQRGAHPPRLPQPPGRRLLAVLRRSYAGSGSPDPDGAVSEVISGTFQFFMYVNVGTPRTRMLALVDTGSDLVWLRCTNGSASPAPAPPAAAGGTISMFDLSSSNSRAARTAGAVQVDRSHRCHARWAMRCRQDLISWSSRMDAAVVALAETPRASTAGDALAAASASARCEHRDESELAACARPASCASAPPIPKYSLVAGFGL